MQGYEEVAYVRFIEGTNTQKVYRFALYDHAVTIGDYALVRSGEPHDLGLVRVVDVRPVSEYDEAAPTAEVVCKVDVASYVERCNQRQREILTDRISKQAKKLTKLLENYRALAAG